MSAIKITPAPDAEEITADLVAQGKTFFEVADHLGVSRRTFARWISHDSDFPELAKAYKEGKQAFAHNLGSQLMAEAKAELHDNPKLANAAVARQRLIVDTAKWVSGKLLPKVYGDNLVIDHKHSGEVTVSPLAQLRQLEGGDDARPTRGRVIDAPEEISEDDCF